MKKIMLWLGAAFLLAGCATADIERIGTASASSAVFTAEQKVLVALPKDGVFQNIKYDYSGQQVQQSFFEALSFTTGEVVPAERVMPLEEALAYAGKIGAQVLVYPVITHWEDRNTPWSGLRDKIRITVQVYSVGPNKVLDRTSLYATNRWFSFVNAAPANLLKKIVNPYVRQLSR